MLAFNHLLRVDGDLVSRYDMYIESKIYTFNPGVRAIRLKASEIFVQLYYDFV